MRSSGNNTLLTILMGVVIILVIITLVFTISVNNKVKDTEKKVQNITNNLFSIANFKDS